MGLSQMLYKVVDCDLDADIDVFFFQPQEICCANENSFNQPEFLSCGLKR